MKKLFSAIFAVFVMSLCVLAETEGETFTLTEYLGISDHGDRIDYINMYSERTFNNSTDFYVSPENDEFLTLADSIVLTDIENKPMTFYKEGEITPRDALYIEVWLDDGTASFALVSAVGEVDRYSLFMSRLPAADCEMSKENFRRLEEMYDGLLSEKQKERIDSLKSGMVELNVQADDDEAVSDENADEKIQYNDVALIIAVSVMAVAVALTLMLTKDKKK